MSDDNCNLDPVMTSRASTTIVTSETTTIGPHAVRPHGPSSAAPAMRRTNRPTAATTATMGMENRHHGNRLARNVDTGTDAAATANTLVQPRIRRPDRSEPTCRRHRTSATR